MNNEAEKYLEPGLLEDYCLGLLPEATAVAITAAIRDSATLQQRVQEIEKALLHYNPAPAGLPLKERILQTLQQLPADTVISLDNPPLITRNSDVIAWNRALENLEPDTEFGSMKVRFIRDTPDWQLCVAWLYESLEETEHPADAFAESFFILEGSCECNIGGQRIRLQAGDYLDIPFDTHHTIRSTTPGGAPVKAIIQRRKTAA